MFLLDIVGWFKPENRIYVSPVDKQILI